MIELLIIVLVIWVLFMGKLSAVSKARLRCYGEHGRIKISHGSFNRQVFHPLIWTYNQVVKDLEKIKEIT